MYMAFGQTDMHSPKAINRHEQPCNSPKAIHKIAERWHSLRWVGASTTHIFAKGDAQDSPALA